MCIDHCWYSIVLALDRDAGRKFSLSAAVGKVSLLPVRTPMPSIPAEARRIIIAHAESTYTCESCGTLLDVGDTVARAIPLDSGYSGPQHDRCEIRPEELLRVERVVPLSPSPGAPFPGGALLCWVTSPRPAP